MYPSFLGADLSPQQQRRLEAAQAKLLVVQDKINKLTAIIADPATKSALKTQAKFWLAIRQKDLIRLQTLIAKLRSTPPEPSPEPIPTPTPGPPQPPPTPVWIDPTGAEPGGLPPLEVPAPIIPAPIVEGVSNTWLILGAVVLFVLFSGRRATA